jgi:hypothetical protein
MASTDELLIKIGADFKDLKANLKLAGVAVSDFSKQAGRDMLDFKKKTDKALSDIKPVTDKAKTAFLAVAASITVLTTKATLSAKTMIKWADSLSISRVEFSKLAAVGARFGAEMDDVGDSIKDLNERIADAASGNKTYEEALNRAGLASQDLINLPLEEQFIRVADAIGKMSNAGDQNFVTAELMADAGFRLLPVFRQGEKAIRAMGDEVIRTGEALNAFQVERIERASKAMNDIGSSATILGNALLDHLAPGFELAAEFMGKFSDVARDLLGQSEEAVRKRLDSIREEKKALVDIGNVEKKGRGRAITEYNSKVRQRIALIQEEVQLENRLAALRSEPEKAQGFEAGPVLGPSIGEGALIPSNDILLEQMNKSADFVKEEWPKIMQSIGEEQGPDFAAGAFIPDEDALMLGMEQNERYLEEMEKFREREFDGEKRHRDRLDKLNEMGFQGRLRMATGFMNDLMSITQNRSKTLFKISKGVAIADALVSTYQGAAKALKLDFPRNLAAMSSVLAAGFAQVNAIKGVSDSGGGGGAAAGGAAATTAEPPTQVLETNVTFSGGGDVSQDQFRAFAEGLNEAAEDGIIIGRINV